MERCMRLLLRSVVVISVLFSAISCAQDVTELTADTFESTTHALDGDNGDWFILFCTPTSDVCQDLTTVWKDVAVTLQGKVHVGEVNVDVNPALTTRFGLTGIASPTMLVLSQGSVYARFQGVRTAGRLSEYALDGFKVFPFTPVPPVDGALPREFHMSNSNAKVVALTTDTFDAVTDATSGNAGVWVVDFYAPWCKHCKAVKPVLEELAPLVDAEDIHVAMVDADEHAVLQSRFRVRSYPTIMVFAQGNMYEYLGSRTVRDLMAFARGGYLRSPGAAVPVAVQPFDASQSAVVELVPDTFDAVTQIQTGGGGDWFMLFHSANCGPCSEVLLVWDQVSADLRGQIHVGKFKVTHGMPGAWGKRFGLFGYPSLVVFSKGRMYRSFRGERDADSLVEYAIRQVQGTQVNSIPVPGPGTVTPMQFHAPIPLKKVPVEAVEEDADDDEEEESHDDDAGDNNDDDDDDDDEDGDDDDDDETDEDVATLTESFGDEHEHAPTKGEADAEVLRESDAEADDSDEGDDEDDDDDDDDEDDDDDDEDEEESEYGTLEEVGDVIALSEREFNLFVQSKADTGAWLIAFVDADSDEWVEDQFDVYDAVAYNLRDTPRLSVAQIDIALYPRFVTQLQLSTPPSIILFWNGTMTPFVGWWTVAALEAFASGGYKSEEAFPLPDPDGIASWQNVPTGAVVSLTTDGFDRIRRSSKPWLIKFYADWCGHCRRLEPIWTGVAQALEGQVHVGQVDVVANIALTKLLQLQGLPTIVLVENGMMHKYKGKRQLTALTAFARSEKNATGAVPLPAWSDLVPDDGKKRPSRVVSLTDATFNGMLTDPSTKDQLPWLVVVYAPPLSDLVDEWVAALKDDVVFGRINVGSDKSVQVVAALRAVGIEFPAILLVSNGSSVVKYTGDWATDDLRAFVSGGFKSSPSMTLPLIPRHSNVVKLAEDNWENVTAKNGTWLVALLAPRSATEHQPFLQLLEEIALSLQQHHVTVASVEMSGAVGLKPFPALVLVYKGESYPYRGPHNAAAIVDFATHGFSMPTEPVDSTVLPQTTQPIGTVPTVLRWADEDYSTFVALVVASVSVGICAGVALILCCFRKTSPVSRAKTAKAD